MFNSDEEGRIDATYLEEPMVIFKLLKAFVNTLPLMCDPVECSENNVCDTATDIEQLEYKSAEQNASTNSFDTVKKIIRVNTMVCPEKQQKNENISISIDTQQIVRRYSKQSSSSPPMHRRYKKESESRRPSIKFSTSTALYTPAKPSYENYSKH